MIREKLIKKRKDCKLTQKQMSGKLKISYETYRSYEYGRREIKSQRLREIANVLNCTIDEII